MKITKRQLKRIIREMHPRAGVDNAIADYLDFVEAKGHITPAASSVIASYFVSKGNWDASHMRVLGDHYGISAEDIQREVSIQRKEMAAGGLSQEVPELTGGRRSSWQVRKEKELGESKTKITKRQLRRIIKEEKQKLLKEQDGDPRLAHELIKVINGGSVNADVGAAPDEVYIMIGGARNPDLDDGITIKVLRSGR
jgi:hypothetical protein